MLLHWFVRNLNNGAKNRSLRNHYFCSNIDRTVWHKVRYRFYHLLASLSYLMKSFSRNIVPLLRVGPLNLTFILTVLAIYKLGLKPQWLTPIIFYWIMVVIPAWKVNNDSWLNYLMGNYYLLNQVSNLVRFMWEKIYSFGLYLNLYHAVVMNNRWCWSLKVLDIDSCIGPS